MCSLILEVDNDEMKYLGNEFEIKMILNNKFIESNPNRFAFRVSSSTHIVRIYDTFRIGTGQNNSESSIPYLVLTSYIHYPWPSL